MNNAKGNPLRRSEEWVDKYLKNELWSQQPKNYLPLLFIGIVSGILVIVLPTVAASGYGRKCDDGDQNSCEIKRNLNYASIPFGIILLVLYVLKASEAPILT